MSELLAPAGNPEKLRAAVLYGADAVYLAGTRFGMRAAADNFSQDELREAVRFAGAHGVRVYLTLNTMVHEEEYPALASFLDSLRGIGIDAVIAGDLGVISLVRQMLPDTEIHVSTQASVTSAHAAEAYHRLGCSRVVLARELTLEEIRAIRRNISRELQLEVFIHGSMCISWSGRCLLSNHFTGRDANRGACAQPCRWNYDRLYEISEEKRPDMRLPVMQTDEGTFVMASRDLCMIEHIPELVEAGIDSFKIEGRIKSAYYTAVTANTYRMALDAYAADPAGYRFQPAWLRELESVSHREYSTGFFFDRPQDNAQTVTSAGYLREKAYLATASSYDPASGTALFIQRNKFCRGDRVELLTPGIPGRPFIASELFTPDGQPLDSVPHPLMEFRLRTPFPVKPGDILRGG